MTATQQNTSIYRLVYRVLTTAVSLVGTYLLFRVVHSASVGTLPETVFSAPPPWAGTGTLLALALSLPVPFHVISIGLVLQKRWLPTTAARIAWFAIVTSGVWLGLALAFKTFVLG